MANGRTAKEKNAILSFARELETAGDVPKGTVERVYFELYMKHAAKD